MAPKQTGRVGDITASRKVEVLDCPLEDLPVFHEQKRPATDHSDDKAQGRLKAEADSEAARMNLLLNRIQARMLHDDTDPEHFDKIWSEEREKLRIKRGEPAGWIPEGSPPEHPLHEVSGGLEVGVGYQV